MKHKIKTIVQFQLKSSEMDILHSLASERLTTLRTNVKGDSPEAKERRFLEELRVMIESTIPKHG